jgi:hypothetical protein
MKLTIEKNPETVKRYQHVRPAPRWGSIACSVQCPGTVRICTREQGHRGPHVAHAKFGKVVAVWDRTAQAEIPAHRPKHSGRTTVSARRASTPVRGGDGGLGVVMKSIWGRVTGGNFTLEDGFLLLLALAMVGFAIDWALRIIGLY